MEHTSISMKTLSACVVANSVAQMKHKNVIVTVKQFAMVVIIFSDLRSSFVSVSNKETRLEHVNKVNANSYEMRNCEWESQNSKGIRCKIKFQIAEHVFLEESMPQSRKNHMKTNLRHKLLSAEPFAVVRGLCHFCKLEINYPFTFMQRLKSRKLAQKAVTLQTIFHSIQHLH